jgi:hypothetical protein
MRDRRLVARDKAAGVRLPATRSDGPVRFGPYISGVEYRVLVVEHVINRGNKPDWAKLLDINMLVLPGGQERTREEFRTLFAHAGLRLRRVYPTTSALSILEAVAA